MTSEWATALQVAGRLLPDLISAIVSMFRGGMSDDEAEDVLRTDIRSRRAEYERERADDEEALEAKWPDHGEDS